MKVVRLCCQFPLSMNSGSFLFLCISESLFSLYYDRINRTVTSALQSIVDAFSDIPDSHISVREGHVN